MCYILGDPDLTNDRFDAATPVDGHISSIKIYQNTTCAEPASPQLVYLPQINR